MKQYLKRHLDRGQYFPRELCLPDRVCYENRMGWRDYALGESLLFSYRNTYYTKTSFDEVPHVHGFCELIIGVRGEVDYVCEDVRLSPLFPAVALFAPGQQHTALLRENCNYERYVFYFRPEVFRDGDSSLVGFAERKGGFVLQIPSVQRTKLLDLLEELRRECETLCDLQLCRALAVHIMALIDRSGSAELTPVALPEKAVAIRQYIDGNFRTIRSVPEIAQKFFYTREHLTRLFRQCYNISVSAYLIRCRLNAGAAALREGRSVTQAALDCGFESLSAFTCAFRKEYGVTPSEYSAGHRSE